jgi:hypothetical protein
VRVLHCVRAHACCSHVCLCAVCFSLCDSFVSVFLLPHIPRHNFLVPSLAHSLSLSHTNTHKRVSLTLTLVLFLSYSFPQHTHTQSLSLARSLSHTARTNAKTAAGQKYAFRGMLQCQKRQEYAHQCLKETTIEAKETYHKDKIICAYL